MNTYRQASLAIPSLCIATALLAACAAPAPTSNGNAVEIWRNFDPSASQPAIPPHTAALVLLRPAAAASAPAGAQPHRAVSIYLDDQYHTSLLPGGLKPAILCPGSLKITVASTDMRSAQTPTQRASTQVQLAPQAIQYIQADADAKQNVQLKTLKPEEAAAILRAGKTQIYTVSRAQQATACPATR